MTTQINGMLKWVTLPLIPCAWIIYGSHRLNTHVKFKMGHVNVSSIEFTFQEMNSIGKKNEHLTVQENV